MGFVKINTDGARDPDTKMAAIGVSYEICMVITLL